MSSNICEESNKGSFFYDEDSQLSFYAVDFRFDEYKKYRQFVHENTNESEIIVFSHEWLLYVPVRRNIVSYTKHFISRSFIKSNIKNFCKFITSSESEFVTEF